MERDPLLKIGQIPKAEQVDMNDSPVSHEEMRAAVDALNEKTAQRSRLKKKEIVQSSVEPALEATDGDTQEVIRRFHTEISEEDNQNN